MSSEKKCCVPGCSRSSDSQTVLHLFPNPAKDMTRFMSWVFNIGGDILKFSNEYIYKNRRVCHAHFELKYCCRYNRISNIAVPTLNLPGLSTLKFTTTSIDKCQRPLKSIENVFNILPSNSEVCTASFQNPDQEIIMSIPPVSMENDNIACQLLGPEQNMMSIPAPAPAIERKQEKTSIFPDNKISSEVCDKDAIQNMQKTGQALKKTKFLRSKMTKTEHELYKKLVDVRIKLSKIRNKAKKQATELKSSKKLFTNVKFIKALENMPSTRRLITLMQFRENKKKEKGRRFSEKEKIASLSIFKQSPKTYRFLRKILILPSPQTLGTLLNQANIGPGINKNVFAQLKA